ncbi:hypothetical protein NIES2109_13460 [Nostoc sp. HK-01]|uniref:Uncharacterized protein n=2 Tax=Nostocales TaxID=1161 RepID=A0A1Z4GIM4_9CYAN|nr:hypothetical protein [Nostoc cycadae]BAY17325.1 hypothetical protein NIES21_31620 [Anabaenopsis circularis NIES-21]BBD58570.1 hypothetical protein NIES2109_13460 [Nostoc sp. HK-01]GBE90920.1 hypothetical protein NCWK1_0640 [Nostoc cycadae WK-1]
MFVKTEINKTIEINNSYLSRGEVQQEKTQPQGLNIPSATLYLSPIGLLFSWIIFFLVLRKIQRFLDNKMVFSVKRLHQVPCKNCRFYSNNHYLKCAVQPSIVLTDEAKNCSEFSAKQDKLSEKQFFHRRD